MTIKKFKKDPSDRLDYLIDWQQFLDEGDVITESWWRVTDTGEEDLGEDEVTLTIDGSEHDDGTAKVWLKGGQVGVAYTVSNEVTTAGGRIIERSIRITVGQL